MRSRTCDVTRAPPECNADPCVGPLDAGACVSGKFKPVNLCRTDALPAGGASAENCKTTGASAEATNSGNVACLNATFDPQVPSPWKSYVMIGSVWTDPGGSPDANFSISTFQDGGPPPLVAPAGFVHLANTTMESWVQDKSTGFAPFGTSPAGCFFCHSLPSHGPALTSSPRFTNGDLSHGFGKINPKNRPKLLDAE